MTSSSSKTLPTMINTTMKKKNAPELLSYMIDLLTHYLNELSSLENAPVSSFIYGEKTAYVECLEILSQWEHAPKHGLSFDIEDRFPLL